MRPEFEGLIRKTADRTSGPFYLYEKSAIRAQCARFTSIRYSHKSVHFASMANAHPDFLATVRQAGMGIFVNSIGHLELARQVGFEKDEIVFTASAMDRALMGRVRDEGVILNLDSTGQLQTWWELFPDASVGIRCNIGTLVTPRQTRGGYFLGPESRLGLSVDEINALQGDPRIHGLHLYLGTDINDLAYFTECYRQVVLLSRLFPALEYLDFGGGFGVETESRTPFDFKRYQGFVTRLMKSVSRDAGRDVRLVLEPGRIIGCEAGHFVCRVTDVKHRAGRQLVGLNGSTAQFTRPLFYPDEAYHPLAPLAGDGRQLDAAQLTSSLYGCSTYSRDYFARDVELPPMRVGDLVVFGHAGAYCASSYTTFLGFPRATEVFV
jgi:diaminopimelate decarboxylase